MHIRVSFDSQKGAQEEKTLPYWIVCVALSQSTYCSGKTLERKGVTEKKQGKLEEVGVWHGQEK